MKKLIVIFTLLFIVLIIARVVFAFYIDAVPVFAVLLAPLVWLSVGLGALTLLFTVIVVYKELKGKPPKGGEE